jgi:hypothetical protein
LGLEKALGTGSFFKKGTNKRLTLGLRCRMERRQISDMAVPNVRTSRPARALRELERFLR